MSGITFRFYNCLAARQGAFKAMETIRERAPAVFDKKGLTLGVKHYPLEREVEALSIQVSAVDMGLRTHGAYKDAENAASEGADTANRNTVCLVVCNERAAATLAKLFTTRSPAGPIIDVDAFVDEHSG
jgi:hypothetical protein